MTNQAGCSSDWRWASSTPRRRPTPAAARPRRGSTWTRRWPAGGFERRAAGGAPTGAGGARNPKPRRRQPRRLQRRGRGARPGWRCRSRWPARWRWCCGRVPACTVRPRGGGDGLEPTTLKGSPAAGTRLLVYRHESNGDRALPDGARAAEGDLVQLAYRERHGGFGLLLSIDGAGAVTLHWPDRAGDSAAPARDRRRGAAALRVPAGRRARLRTLLPDHVAAPLPDRARRRGGPRAGRPSRGRPRRRVATSAVLRTDLDRARQAGAARKELR